MNDLNIDLSQQKTENLDVWLMYGGSNYDSLKVAKCLVI